MKWVSCRQHVEGSSFIFLFSQSTSFDWETSYLNVQGYYWQIKINSCHFVDRLLIYLFSVSFSLSLFIFVLVVAFAMMSLILFLSCVSAPLVNFGLACVFMTVANGHFTLIVGFPSEVLTELVWWWFKPLSSCFLEISLSVSPAKCHFSQLEGFTFQILKMSYCCFSASVGFCRDILVKWVFYYM